MRIVSALAALAVAAGLAAVAAAQSALPMLMAAANSETAAVATPYAYEVTVESERGRMRYAFDPTRTGAARVRLLEPAEGALEQRDRDALARIREDADGDIWCASRKLGDITNVSLLRESESEAVYAFTPSPALARRPDGATMMRHLRGEAVVLKDSRDVRELRIYAPRPFHASVARIDAFDMRIRCEAAPNGRRYGAETRTAIRGSALLQAFNATSVQRVVNLHPAR
jgi:hypothetical protein